MVGAEVTELIQGYVVAMNLETTEEELMHTVFPHPTLSEMMKEAVLDAYGRVLEHVSGDARRRMAKFDNILGTDRQHAGRQDQQAGAEGRQPLRQDRGLQSARLGQGPPRARRHRGGGEVRRAQARPDRDRGDLRQHRHRPRHGLRRQGLSAGRHHGGDLQRRAAQADALPRRQGDPDAGRRAAASAWSRRRRNSPRRTAGS